jgi:hypothetical protein
MLIQYTLFYKNGDQEQRLEPFEDEAAFYAFYSKARFEQLGLSGAQIDARDGVSAHILPEATWRPRRGGP